MGIERSRGCRFFFVFFFLKRLIIFTATKIVPKLSPVFPSASPPDFTGNLLRALLKAKAGSTVTLECKPQAYPMASILWKKGNLPIHINDR